MTTPKLSGIPGFDRLLPTASKNKKEPAKNLAAAGCLRSAAHWRKNHEKAVHINYIR